MSFKPQIRTANPTIRSPSKKENLDEIPPFDKRRKVGLGKMVGPANGVRGRQVFQVVNAGQDPGNDPAANGTSECGSSGGIEFTREDVEVLLNEKMKGKNKFDYKGKCEHMTEYIKKLRVCIKWFQELEESYLLEQEKLRDMLKSMENKCDELELQMTRKEKEMNATITDLRTKCTLLQEDLGKEKSEKMGLIEINRKEKEARLAVEKMKENLLEELERVQQEALGASQQITSLQEINKRLQEYNTSLQQYNSKLQTDAATAAETLSRMQKEKSTMMENLSTLRGHSALLQEQLTSSKASQQEAIRQKEMLMNEVGCLRGELQQVRDDRDLQAMQVQSLKAEIDRYNEITGKSSLQLEKLTTKTSVLEDTCTSQKEEIRTLQYQLAAATEKLEMADITAVEKMSEYEKQRKEIEDLRRQLADADFQIVEAEKLRKKLHNEILELKGNIRVFCRVRPLLPDDDCNGTESAAISYPSSLEFLGRGVDVRQNGQNYSFTFDKVFNHEASQQEVFVEISQLVQSALDGYKASMLEIYNETIRDLLYSNRSSNQDNSAPGKQYTIKHDANGNTYVSDLTVVDVCSIREVSSLLHQAAQSRSVGKTQMNEQSSRSHFVFTLRITGVNESTEQQVHGVLNLIDLAGSERLSKSGSTGDRLKETQAINKSLSCLSDVIFSIAKKEDHVPFRNSKLTYLLQPCLGGNSKTLMFVNVSPDPSSANESLCSLRFAARVNACEIGVPRRQTHVRSMDSRLSYG
ncbi:hypothetical protein ACLOJK_039635 [Asimina triloba]